MTVRCTRRLNESSSEILGFEFAHIQVKVLQTKHGPQFVRGRTSAAKAWPNERREATWDGEPSSIRGAARGRSALGQGDEDEVDTFAFKWDARDTLKHITFRLERSDQHGPPRTRRGDGKRRIGAMADQWLFKSETYDNCNCAMNCGCQFNLPSTRGYCQSAFVGNIVEGHFNDTPLAGLNSGGAVQAARRNHGRKRPTPDRYRRAWG